jgi:hypothetical protein
MLAFSLNRLTTGTMAHKLDPPVHHPETMLCLDVGQYLIYKQTIYLHDFPTALTDQVMVSALARQLVMVVFVVQVQLVDQTHFFELVQSAIDRAQTQPWFTCPCHVIQIIGAGVSLTIVQQLEQQQPLGCDPAIGHAQHLSKFVFGKSVRLSWHIALLG